MTATEVAPAWRTDSAVSIVMPPIATTGIGPANCAANDTSSRPTAEYSRLFRVRSEYGTDGDDR